MANSAVVGVLRAMLTADTAEYDTRMRKAGQTTEAFSNNVVQMGAHLAKLTPQAERMAKAFSGDKMLASANNLTSAINKIGGATKLTEAQQASVNRTLSEAISKYAALGQVAPKAMLDLEKATRKVVAPTDAVTQKMVTMGSAIGSFIGVVAAQAFSKAAQAASEFVAQGVKFTGIAQSFDLLAKSINTTSAAMLGTMRPATRGLVSDLDLMQSANRAMLLGLPVTAEEMGKLAKTATILGRAMGQDATKSLDDLITALGRSSPMILDNLGLTVKVGEANEAYARKLGKSTQALTESEQKMAFYVAALAAADKKVAALGEVHLTLADRAQQAATAVRNVAVRLVAAVNEGQPAALGLAAAIGAIALGLAVQVPGAIAVTSSAMVGLNAVLLTATRGFQGLWIAATGPVGAVVAGIGAVVLALTGLVVWNAKSALTQQTNAAKADMMAAASRIAKREVTDYAEAVRILEAESAKAATAQGMAADQARIYGEVLATGLRAIRAESVANVALREGDQKYWQELGQLAPKTLKTVIDSMRDGSRTAKEWSDEFAKLGIVLSPESLTRAASNIDKVAQSTQKAGDAAAAAAQKYRDFMNFVEERRIEDIGREQQADREAFKEGFKDFSGNLDARLDAAQGNAEELDKIAKEGRDLENFLGERRMEDEGRRLQHIEQLRREALERSEAIYRMFSTAIADGFASMLVGANNFKDGFLDIWRGIQQSMARILSDILNDFIGRFLKGMVGALAGKQGAFQSAFSGIVGGGLSGGSGAGIAGGVAGLLGIGGTSAVAADVAGVAAAVGGGGAAAGAGAGAAAGGGAMAGLGAFFTNPWTIGIGAGILAAIGIKKFAGPSEAYKARELQGTWQRSIGDAGVALIQMLFNKKKISKTQLSGLFDPASREQFKDTVRSVNPILQSSGGAPFVRPFNRGGFVPPGVVQPAILHGGRRGEIVVPLDKMLSRPNPQAERRDVHIHATFNSLDPSTAKQVFVNEFLPMLHMEMNLNQHGTNTLFRKVTKP